MGGIAVLGLAFTRRGGLGNESWGEWDAEPLRGVLRATIGLVSKALKAREWPCFGACEGPRVFGN